MLEILQVLKYTQAQAWAAAVSGLLVGTAVMLLVVVTSDHNSFEDL